MRYSDLVEGNTPSVIKDNISEYKVLSDDQVQNLIQGSYSQAHAGTPLYRGVASLLKYKHVDAALVTRTKNRRSRSKDVENATVFNDLMAHKKMPFRKDNTVSVTTSFERTKTFGSSYRCLPSNGTEFLHSNLYDLIKLHSVYTVVDFLLLKGYDDHQIPNISLSLSKGMPEKEDLIDLYLEYLDHLWVKYEFKVSSNLNDVAVNATEGIEVLFIPSKPYLIIKES